MAHPNDMTAWDDIACRRGCERHATRTVAVDLSEPHGYADLTPIPASLARRWDMAVWDPDLHPVDGGDYCPARDACSSTIVSDGVWEPAETVLALSVLGSAAPDQRMIDVGCQIGWYTCLAATQGVPVVAVDADADNLTVLHRTVDANGWGTWVDTHHLRVGPDTAPLGGGPVRLVKIDVEGAEADAVAWLGPLLDAQLVDHLLVEVSPVFHGGYTDLARALVAYGFEAWRLPAKQIPPVVIDTPPDGLTRMAPADLDGIDSWHQDNVWFRHRQAGW